MLQQEGREPRAPVGAIAVGDKLLGLASEQLADYGLSVIEGKCIQGPLLYERPTIAFDPRRIKNSSLGVFTYINGYQSGSLYSCEVGRYCSIAEEVMLGAPEHPSDWLSSHPFAFTRREYLPKFYKLPEFERLAPDGSEPTPFLQPAKTYFGHDVWIGAGVFVKRGVRIGDGAIVAARAVVTRDVAPYAIVAGLPAKTIRLRFPESIVERLLKLQWWRYDLAPHKHDVDFSKIEATLDLLETRAADGRLQILQPEAYRVIQNNGRFDIERLPAPLY
ncbi:MAG: antibiotic acetyltransferase [Nevskia sp.]|nr:antibiotic acetyltransferase [Nevskia sp.]